MMRKILCLGLLSLIIILSCSKKDDYPGHNPCAGENKTFYILSADLQYCKYKTNTYWVYVDSVSNSFDSVSIQSFNQGFLEDVCGNSYEIHSFKTISSYSSIMTDYAVVAGGLFKDFNGRPNSGTQIYDDFDVTSSTSSYQIEKFDSLLIFDQFYKRVLKVKIENDHTENKNKSIYFINSEYGFLKHDIYKDNILISSKILMRKNIER